jgi:hypothetical protein
VKDKITGFKGILTARHTYITGCDQYTISPVGLDNENKLKELYSFDEGRIEILGPGINEKEVQAETKGGPQRMSTSVK